MDIYEIFPLKSYTRFSDFSIKILYKGGNNNDSLPTQFNSTNPFQSNSTSDFDFYNYSIFNVSLIPKPGCPVYYIRLLHIKLITENELPGLSETRYGNFQENRPIYTGCVVFV